MIKLVRSCLLAAALACPASALAASNSGSKFVSSAIKGDNGEIEIGTLAQQKDASQDVKAFGKTLVTDHTQAKTQMTLLAQRMHMTPPQGAPKQASTELARLKKMNGRNFDREFARYMVKDHKSDIAKFQKEANAGDGPISKLAQEQLPVLEKHLQMAQSLTQSSGAQ